MQCTRGYNGIAYKRAKEHGKDDNKLAALRSASGRETSNQVLRSEAERNKLYTILHGNARRRGGILTSVKGFGLTAELFL